jgi:hypothetical protein
MYSLFEWSIFKTEAIKKKSLSFQNIPSVFFHEKRMTMSVPLFKDP